MTSDADLRLPESTRSAVSKADETKRHPGLQLDKYSRPGDQKAQKTALDKVLKCQGDEALLKKLRVRRYEHLQGLSTRSWSATTAGPLTLHLSRASALENAGICLHPLYGFVYLPGSGLKGMARAYAETVWLASKPVENQDPAADIKRVFGWAPKGQAKGSAGTVIFHDAWPETWPKLIVDIVNNHHKKYYGGEDAPGDWENPEPSYFLAVPAGVAFSFALSPRRPNDGDLALAKQWLTGALCHLGAGAKTAAGYGAFKLINNEAPPASPKAMVHDETKWTEWSGTLELVTPAFLAGASQKADDCDLRPATLRGLLRWWWRTMHAAYLSVDELRALEAAVWGNTKAGSPVALSVAPRVRKDPVPWRGKRGLAYSSYGMEENQRSYMPEGASWDVRMVAHAARFPPGTKADEGHVVISPPMILAQAHAALWLLCHFGGIGSKARKGFGSLKDIDAFNIETCKAAAQRFRDECGAKQSCDPLATPAIEGMLSFSDLPLEGTSSQVLDRVGTALQAFAKGLPEKTSREGLGLPRRVSIPEGKEIWLGEDHPKRGNREAKDMRDAAPVHFHAARSVSGALVLRVAAFPSPYLPDLEKNGSVLRTLLSHLSAQFGSASQKKILRPGLIFAKGDEVENKTTGERATVCDDVRIGTKKMDIDYGGGDFDTKNPADWRLVQ